MAVPGSAPDTYKYSACEGVTNDCRCHYRAPKADGVMRVERTQYMDRVHISLCIRTRKDCDHIREQQRAVHMSEQAVTTIGSDPRQASLVSRCRSHRIGKRLKGGSIWRTNTQIHGSYILVHGILRNNECGSSNVGHYCYGMPRRRVLCIW